MGVINDIFESDKKPKEKVSLLADRVKENKKLLSDIVKYFETGSVVDQGNCIEVMEFVSKNNPELVIPFLDFIIEHLNDKAPKIKWECARVIGNLTPKYPEETVKAIDK